jgi:hypothetical protein
MVRKIEVRFFVYTLISLRPILKTRAATFLWLPRPVFIEHEFDLD